MQNRFLQSDNFFMDVTPKDFQSCLVIWLSGGTIDYNKDQ